MDDNVPPPPELTQAVAALWRLDPPGPSNLFSAPPFVQLRETCQKLYPKAGSKDALSSALSNALRPLGWPAGLAPHHAHLALPVEVAAARLDAAFRRPQSRRVHLCPLDCADDLPTLSFGPNSVSKMSAAELEALVDPRRLKRISPTWVFDAKRFSEFSWLVVKEVVPLDGEPGARAVPALFIDLSGDFGAIEPHQKRFTTAVEGALFAVLLAPWEDWVLYRDLDWRGFRVPWIYTIDDDIFAPTLQPPSPETLSWQPDFFIDEYGEEVEVERPTCLPLSDCAAKELEWPNDAGWADLISARESSLFGTPVEHFLVRGFLDDGIDEFLAHITVVEAALGMSSDYDAGTRRKLPNRKNPGATARVAARLSALLGSSTAGDGFKRLFDVRSAFLHGRTMSPISSQERILARRLARETAVALMKAALTKPVSLSRDTYLDELLNTGFKLA